MNVLTVRMGVTNCYLIQDKGTVMVDSGPPNKAESFFRAMRKAGIDPRQIKLIVHTHGHWDHVGSAKVLKEATGAQIAMRQPDKDWLENSTNHLPAPVTTWGRILMRLMSRYMRSARVSATVVDIVLGDDEFSLVPFGVPGKVVCTPGHSSGSVTVLLENGDACVGDLAMNGFPFHFGPGLPIWADDLELAKRSWRMLLDRGVKRAYPGHGKPFSVDALRRALQ